jgi:uncharacterized repeat protein (TIGR02543 family)
VAPGTATITVTTGDGGYTATCDITVQEGVPATRVSLDKTSDTITVRGSDTLTATVAPEDATDPGVTWTTSDATVATVDNTATGGATVTGVAAGTATITATTTDGGYTASCQVTVQTVAATGVTLDKTSDTISAGGSDTLTATMVPDDATNQNVTWTTSDAAVAPITFSGDTCTVGGLAAGDTTITATTEDGSYTATCDVTITATAGAAPPNTLFQPGYGDGSSANPYILSTAGDLVLLDTDVNAGSSYSGKYFQLANDIDLSSVCGATPGNWKPIGANSKTFSGTLDGNNYAIENLYISTSTADAQDLGLFANTTDATIENLTVSGSIQITNGMYDFNCAGIAANTTGSTFRNCVNRVSITIDQNTWMCWYFGGIVGTGSSVTISGCTNYGSITGNSYGGGIAGVTGTGDNVVENCANYGNLTSTGGGEYAGILGMADAKTLISGCTNYGAISAGLYSQGYLAGIVATSQASTTVTNCANQGSISGSAGYTGGIAANSSPPASSTGGGYMALTNCSNSGSVTDTSSTGPVGGIIANCANDPGSTDLTGCSNSGSVTGLSDVGGLVGTLLMYNGSSPLILSGSYNTGPVTGTSGGSADSSIGGLVGYADQYYTTTTNSGGTYYNSYSSQPILIKNCYNTGAVAAPNTPDVGGLIGSANSNGASTGIALENCYNAGAVTGMSDAGGLAGLLTTVRIVSKSGQVTDEFAPLTIENCYSAAPSVAASVYAGTGIGQITVYNSPSCLTISNVFARSCGSLPGIGGDTSGTDPCGVTTLSNSEMQDPSFVTLLGGAFTGSAGYQSLYGSYGYPVLLALAGGTPSQTYNVQFAGAENTTVQTGGVDTYATTVAPGGSVSFTVTSNYPSDVTVESVAVGGNALTPSGGVYTINDIQANTVVTVTTEGAPSANTYNVSFDVTDAGGNPISGATIAVTGQQPGSDGSYSLPAGTYQVSFSKAGYDTISGSFNVSVSGTVYATLYQGSDCNLTLKTGSDGYYVNIYDGSVLIGATAGTTQEDADGYYDTSFSLPAGSYTYTATGTANSEPWSGLAMGSGPLKITGDETLTMRLLDFTDGGGQFSNPNSINYSMTIYAADGTQYFPGSASASSGGDAAGYFVLPAAAEGVAYNYAFLPANNSYWGDSGTTYLYDLPTGQFFASLNLSDSFGQFIITPKGTLTITAPTGAELQLLRRVKFYQPLEELTATGTQDNGDGTTTYSYVAPANYNYLQYQLRMPGYVKKAGFIDGSSTSIPLSSLTPDTGQDIADSQYAADIVMNAPDSKYITLTTGQQFQLYLYRNWQAINSITVNYYVDPDYNVQVISGDSVQITDPYYAGATIEAVKSGVSIVRITYGPLDYYGADGQPHVYSKLWEQNTVLLVVNVNPAGSATIDPGIPLMEFDTVYYTRSINGVALAAADQYAQYTFTPTVTNGALASVSLHAPVGSTGAWDDTAWTNLTANADGSYTAKLTDGRSIIRITAADGTVSYFVIKAYGVNVTIAGNNVQTSLNGRQFQVSAGTGSAQVSYDGLEMPFPKLGAIYNPGFGGQTYLVYTLDNPSGTAAFVYSEGTQYDIATTNAITLNLANPGEYDLTDGSIHTTSIGANGGTHRYMTEGGLVGDLQYTYTGGNSNQTVNGLFCVLPDLDIQAGSPATGVSLDKTSDTIATGGSDTLTATVTPTGAGEQGLTWTTSDASVASIVYSGTSCTVTGVAAGSATITVTTADGSFTATCDVTVPAVAAQTYSVTYDANGATGTAPTDSNTYAAGATVTLPASVSGLVYSGYTFEGWSLTPGGAAISGTTYTMGSADVTLYAVWTQISATTYTVTYDANGGAGTAPTDSNTYAAGATVTVLGQGSLTAPTGDTFGGWSTAPSAGTAYQPGAQFQMGSANVTLYAVWNSGGGTESFPILSAKPSFFERLY